MILHANCDKCNKDYICFVNQPKMEASLGDTKSSYTQHEVIVMVAALTLRIVLVAQPCTGNKIYAHFFSPIATYEIFYNKY